MASLSTSIVKFSRGMWAAFLAGLAAITDPLALVKMTGLVDQRYNWALGEEGMRAFFLAFALIWTFLWFHGVQKDIEQGSLDPDMPLHIACRWVARDSVWAAKYEQAFDHQWPNNVDDEVMSKLITGKIEMFGRRRESNLGKGPMQYVTPNDKDKVQWDSSKLLTAEPPTHMWVTGGPTYSMVKLDSRQVQRVWPRKTLWHRFSRRSPIERIGIYSEIFAKQDRYYQENFGFSPIPLAAILETA